MSCYMCNKEKVSVEHAPPKSFFPSGMRNNLITVDSCQEHNEDTSLDDEYVKNLITMLIGGNSTAYKQFSEKTIKSFKRSSALLQSTTEKQHPVNFNGVQTVAFEIDRDRVDLVMRKIAYALFYHKYNQRWLRKLITATTHLKTTNFENDDFGQLIEEVQQQRTPTYEGDNPDVFQFAFITIDDDINNQFLRMKFYDGFEIWMIPDENTGESEPELNTVY
ncbi:MAG: hypothetical protein NTY39_04785 [Campylobacterales bacterium]|nr:hypothetical protein [Campylobacterales bacterium]